MKQCSTCRCEIDGMPQAIGRNPFCKPCFEKAQKVRLERMRVALAGRNRLSIYWQQIRDAIAERDKIRAETSNLIAIRDVMAERDKIRAETASIIASCHDAAVANVKDSIRRMGFWQRFKLLFNPFGVQW